MRTYIIGDIHGCVSPLRKLLNRLAPDPAADRLIILGDLFDRGPDSWEVFQLVKELELSFGKRFILLRGNHEDYLLQKKLSLSQRLVWDRVGRGTTVRSFKQHGEKMKDCAPWLREHTVMYYQGEGFRCVHAGFKIDPPELNDAYTMIHDHGVVLANRYSGPLTVTGHIALPKPSWFAGDGKTVKELENVPEGAGTVPGEGGFAHNAACRLPERGVICIDTGCGKGGSLTGMVIEDGNFRLYSVGEK